jgi:hypothetical protein
MTLKSNRSSKTLSPNEAIQRYIETPWCPFAVLYAEVGVWMPNEWILCIIVARRCDDILIVGFLIIRYILSFHGIPHGMEFGILSTIP